MSGPQTRKRRPGGGAPVANQNPNASRNSGETAAPQPQSSRTKRRRLVSRPSAAQIRAGMAFLDPRRPR
jgi:hypothetical protein